MRIGAAYNGEVAVYGSANELRELGNRLVEFQDFEIRATGELAPILLNFRH